MLCCLDVHYDDDEAVTAAVLFTDWLSAHPRQVVIGRLGGVQPYQPGQFYRRELPPLLDALEKLTEPPALLLIDGYVWLDDSKPGLGAHLYQALGQTVPVVGLAKSEWPGLRRCLAVCRGNSGRRLWLTAIGVELEEVAEEVVRMHGPFRLPTMVRLADTLCRKPWLAS